MLQGKCRTRTSELICKHWVLREAAAAGPFTFPFSQREPSGRCRHNVASEWFNSKRFLLKDSVRASWFKEDMLYEARGTWQDVLCSPCWALAFEASWESQMHIAAMCSGFNWKVGSIDPTEEILEINNAGIIHLETLAVKVSSLTSRPHFTFLKTSGRQSVPLAWGYDNRFSWGNICEFSSSNAGSVSSLLACSLCSPFQLALFSPTCPSIVWDSLLLENRAHSVNKGSTR